MIVDTGSHVSIVPRDLLDKNQEHWPPLQTTHIKFSCYLGKLAVLGKLDMPVCYNKVVKSSLIVLNCSQGRASVDAI